VVRVQVLLHALLRAWLSAGKDALDSTTDTPMRRKNEMTPTIARQLGEATVREPRLRRSLAEATEALMLADDTRLLLRPIGREDREALAALFARLTPESRHRRFLSPKHELTPRELAFFTDIDHVAHEAIVALDQRDGAIVGVGRYVHCGDRAGVVEVAVVVADEFQRLGIGAALARSAVRRARANGFALMTATTLRDNRPARALVRRLGFRARASSGREIEFELHLEPTSKQETASDVQVVPGPSQQQPRTRTVLSTHHHTNHLHSTTQSTPADDS
jgi:GNAT superfamily N-acetyltransferase